MGELVDITSADLAGIYSELAETVGVENAYEIYKQFKGMQMMFPLKFYSPEYTKRIWKEERESGISVRELVRKHELSESRVRQILREGKDESK